MFLNKEPSSTRSHLWASSLLDHIHQHAGAPLPANCQQRAASLSRCVTKDSHHHSHSLFDPLENIRIQRLVLFRILGVVETLPSELLLDSVKYYS